MRHILSGSCLKSWIFSLLYLTGIALVAHSCNSSRITSSWNNGKRLDHMKDTIVVIALPGINELKLGQLLEQHIANDLLAVGYPSSSASKLFGQLAFCPGTDSSVFAMLYEKGITVAMTVALLDKQTVQKFVPGHYIKHPDFMDYVGPKYASLYEPAHVEYNTNYYWETRLYAIPSQELIYRSRSSSIEPAGIRTLAHEYGRKISRDMIRKKIIVPVIIPDDQ
jgi:hypothetical protein